MFVIPLIERKRNGQSLTPEEWRALVNEYTAGRVPDYQMAALLMAVFLNGLTTEELGALTNAMRDSGARLEFGDHVGPRIDKHSTGGVGDKVSLILFTIYMLPVRELRKRPFPLRSCKAQSVVTIASRKPSGIS